MYEKVIINNLHIDEPFHTIFFRLLQIYDQTNSWLKSEHTKSLKLKIRKKDATFEEGISFKVYSVSEIAFDFLDNILQYLRSHRYLKKDEQTIILVALLYKINNVKELQYLCPNCREEMELRDCIVVKVLLNKFDKKSRFFSFLSMLENGDEQLQFINEIYKETLASQKEYPFVLKKNEDVKKFSLDCLVNEKEKKLISLDRF